MNAGKRKLSICTVLALLAASVGSDGMAEVNVGTACTASRWPTNPPAITETGLGDDVDKLAYVPERLRSEIKSLKDAKWKFLYGPNSRTERGNQEIYIQQSSSALTGLNLLSHEIGHATYSPPWDYSSKEAYLRIACMDEGRAVYENVIARRTIQACPAQQGGGVDIGLAAAQPWEPYVQKVENESLPFDYASLGMMFCQSNVVSTTGQSYLDYYGDWYDKHYGTGMARSSGSEYRALPAATPEFWKKIDDIARASTKGVDKLKAIWPSDNLQRSAESTAQSLTLNGGRYQLDAATAITTSTLSASPSGNVALAKFTIEGVCISRQDIEQRYPDLTLFDVPRAPGASASWAAYGVWGRVVFVFRNDGPCLTDVVFDPTPKMPQAFPED